MVLLKTRSLPSKSLVFFLLIGGFTLITLNVFLVHEVSESWFEGSDASYLYATAKTFASYPSTILSLDNRYVGYTLFQLLSSFPLTNHEFAASLLIRYSNWTIWILSFIFIVKRIRYAFGLDLSSRKFFTSVVNSIMLWVSLYNFRDTIIMSLCSTLLVMLASFRKKEIPLFLVLCVFLWFFRYFFLYSLAFSLFTAIVALKLLKPKNAIRKIIAMAFLLMITVSLLPTELLSYLATSFSQDFRYFVSVSSYSLQELFRGLLSSFIAGNPLKFVYSSIGLGVDRAFVITSLSAIFQWSVYLATYTILIPFFTLVLFTNDNQIRLLNNHSQSMDGTRSKQIFVFTTVVFVTLVLLIYSLFYGGTQERIRAVIIIPVAILFEIAKEQAEDHTPFSKAMLFSVILMLVFVMVNPL